MTNICAVTRDGTLARHEAEDDAAQAREDEIARRLVALRLQLLAPTDEARDAIDEWFAYVMADNEVVSRGLAESIQMFLGSGSDYLELSPRCGMALRAAWNRHLLDLATREADDEVAHRAAERIRAAADWEEDA